MDKPFFSIIIPAYNSEKTIDVAIGSILKQQYNAYEVLVIDGLSKDKTLEKVRSYNDARLKIHSEKDNGIYDAMNKGVALASGTWLMFLGSDDELYDSNVLGDVYTAINKNDRVIYGNVMLKGNTGWGNDGQLYDGEFTIQKLLKVNIAHQAIFYHKEVFIKCGVYNLNYKVCADFDMNLKAASKYKLKYIDRTIANFFAGGASTNTGDASFEKDYNHNIIKYFKNSLYNSSFKGLERQIIKQAKNNLRQLKAASGFYLLLIGMYFKVKRKITQ